MFDLSVLTDLFVSSPLAKVSEIPRIYYAIPLIIAISLVYGATRHEYLKEIVSHSIKSMFWVVGFMAVIFAIIFVTGYWN